MDTRMLGLFAVTALLSSLSAHAQFAPPVTVTDANGLMWANTVGVGVYWEPNPGTIGAQAWVDGLNAENYGGYSDWTLATGDGSVAPNTTTNQLGELFYTDCGNTLGSKTSLSRNNCGVFTSLQPVIDADIPADRGIDMIISSTPFHQLDDFEQQGFWGYSIGGSGPEVRTTDEIDNGDPRPGIGDALAVRVVNQAPELDPASAATGFTLLIGFLLVLRGRRERAFF